MMMEAIFVCFLAKESKKNLDQTATILICSQKKKKHHRQTDVFSFNVCVICVIHSIKKNRIFSDSVTTTTIIIIKKQSTHLSCLCVCLEKIDFQAKKINKKLASNLIKVCFVLFV